MVQKLKINMFSRLPFSEKGVHFNRKHSKHTILEIINYRVCKHVFLENYHSKSFEQARASVVLTEM